MQYKVTWLIDVEAKNPSEAARKALKIQRDPGSIATVFEVKKPGRRGKKVVVDLSASGRAARH